MEMDRYLSANAMAESQLLNSSQSKNGGKTPNAAPAPPSGMAGARSQSF